MSIPLSVLDLSPIPVGGNGAQALHNTLHLAQRVEDLGYGRYWLAEHHNMSGLAGVTPEVLIGSIAQRTTHIRLGSGAVLLPNYAPLKVAETFRTLEALTPGRIDLGIGRAPRMDRRSALALRGSEKALNAAADIARQVAELEGFAEVAPSAFPEGHQLRDVIASPEGVPFPPIWLLGSGQLSAQVAAARGRGFAAAYHFSPLESAPAIRAYKANFQPSSHFPRPSVIATISVICAETDDLAAGLARAGGASVLALPASRACALARRSAGQAARAAGWHAGSGGRGKRPFEFPILGTVSALVFSVLTLLPEPQISAAMATNCPFSK